jgi:hypothetical protein
MAHIRPVPNCPNGNSLEMPQAGSGPMNNCSDPIFMVLIKWDVLELSYDLASSYLLTALMMVM